MSITSHMARQNVFLFVDHANSILDHRRRSHVNPFLPDSKPLGHWNVLRCQIQSYTQRHTLMFKGIVHTRNLHLQSRFLASMEYPMAYVKYFPSDSSYPISSVPSIVIPAIYSISALPSFTTSVSCHTCSSNDLIMSLLKSDLELHLVLCSLCLCRLEGSTS